MTTPLNDPEEHRRLREQLGSYVLGHLRAPAADAVRAHLDGCADCRAQVEDLQPVVRGLDVVDLHHVEAPESPPAALGELIRSRVAEERTRRDAEDARGRRRFARSRTSRHLGQLTAAAAVLAVALGAGAVVGRATAPKPPAVPLESIALRPVGNSGVTVQDANLVPHTWGVEVRFAGSGFHDGEVYRAEVRETDGTLIPAGEFLGTGGSTLTCNLQSALLRDKAVRFVVEDQAGTPVLAASLPPQG